MDRKIEQLKQIDYLLNEAEFKELACSIAHSDLIEDWDYFDPEQQIRIFLSMNTEDKVDLINELSFLAQANILKVLSKENLRILLAEMEPDDIADFMQAITSDVRKLVWENLDDETRKETLFLLRFDEDDAAGIMTPRYMAIRSNITAASAIHFIRSRSGEVETIYYIYVVDQFQRLIGVVSIKKLLMAADDHLISEIMDQDVVSVHQETDQEDAARILEKHNLVALPVTDQSGKLLGIITFDDIIDVIREEQTEDVYKMSGMEGSVDRYLETGIIRLIKKRIPWLIILLLVGTITTNVLDHYQELLNMETAAGIITGAAFLISFLPVITQTGGNSGGQSSTLMIRGLATGEIHFRDLGKIISKELLVGILMGIITGIVIILRSVLLPPGIDWYQALMIGSSLTLVVTFSTIIGALAPLLIHRIGLDPTVMSAPLMATVIDVCALTIYFETARFMLRLF